MTETDDVVALWRLQARYADLVTRRAWRELHAVFRPDARVEVDTVTRPIQAFTGPDAFGDFVAGAIARFDHFEFVILNTIVEVTSESTATGRILMCEIRHERGADSWSIAYGCYDDSYVKVEGRWWFDERRYRSMARTGPEAGVFGLPNSVA